MFVSPLKISHSVVETHSAEKSLLVREDSLGASGYRLKRVDSKKIALNSTEVFITRLENTYFTSNTKMLTSYDEFATKVKNYGYGGIT